MMFLSAVTHCSLLCALCDTEWSLTGYVGCPWQVAYYKRGQHVAKLLAGLSSSGNVVGLLTGSSFDWALPH